MSPLLKSELRLRLGPRHCQAEVWRAGLNGRCIARHFLTGQPEQIIGDALDVLQGRTKPLPDRAVALVEDELLFFATLPADVAMGTVSAVAQRHFDDILGPERLLVDVTLAPCGTRWVAAALYADQIDTWRERLTERDIQLGSVRAALFEDLRHLRAEVPLSNGLLVMVRSEGLSFVGLRQGGVKDVVWDRCDVDDLEELAARVHTRASQWGVVDQTAEVCLAPLHSSQVQALQGPADHYGWQMTRPVLAVQD